MTQAELFEMLDNAVENSGREFANLTDEIIADDMWDCADIPLHWEPEDLIPHIKTWKLARGYTNGTA